MEEKTKSRFGVNLRQGGMIFALVFIILFFGIVTGVYLTVSHLAGLLSFGVPYLSPFVKQSTDNGTGSKIVRVPFKKRWRRPSYVRQNERVRLQKIRDKNRKDR